MARIDPGTGIIPEVDVIAYKVVNPNGDIEYHKVLAWTLTANGNYRAWVQHPRMGLQIMDPNTGYLSKAEPIRVQLAGGDAPANDAVADLVAEHSILKAELAENAALKAELAELKAVLTKQTERIDKLVTAYKSMQEKAK